MSETNNFFIFIALVLNQEKTKFEEIISSLNSLSQFLSSASFDFLTTHVRDFREMELVTRVSEKSTCYCLFP